MKNIEGKYFIDENKYNCPFCQTRSVKYTPLGIAKFNEKKDKIMYAVFVECAECYHISMHLIKKDDDIFRLINNTFSEDTIGIQRRPPSGNFLLLRNTGSMSTKPNLEISNALHCYYSTIENGENVIQSTCDDEHIILSIPTSSFTIDERIPKTLRELIGEAERCIQNGCLVGASACIRKAIYEFLIKEKASGDSVDEKIKSLKSQYKTLDDDYIDMLCGIKGIMCDQVHEASIHKSFSGDEGKAYIEILKEIFKQVYILPKEASEKKLIIDKLAGKIKSQRNKTT